MFDVGAIHVTDIDGDSVQELLVGEGQWGDVIAFDTVTQQQEWFIANPEHGVTDVAVGDVYGDGDEEVLWGAGATSTGADRLYVADWQTSMIEWENIQLEGPFLGPAMGDLDGDGIELPHGRTEPSSGIFPSAVTIWSWGSSMPTRPSRSP